MVHLTPRYHILNCSAGRVLANAMVDEADEVTGSCLLHERFLLCSRQSLAPLRQGHSSRPCPFMASPSILSYDAYDGASIPGGYRVAP